MNSLLKIPIPLLILVSCSTTEKSLSPLKISKLSSCNITLTKAKENLKKLGFKITKQKQDFFFTDFKESPYQNTTYLLGAPYEIFTKQFHVKKIDKSISFSVLYKNRIFSHPANEQEEIKEVEKRELFLEKELINLNKIKTEVCGKIIQKSIITETPTTCESGNVSRCLINAYKELSLGNRAKSKEIFKKACDLKSLEACLELKNFKK